MRQLDRLADVARLQRGQLVQMLFQQVGQLVERGGARAWPDARPAAILEGGLGGGDG